MHLKEYLSIFAFIALIHLAQSEEDTQEPDIDKVLYLCGNKIATTLSMYCQSYYVRSKRSVSRTCCYGLGCSIRYAVETYCMEIRPKYSYLFNTKPKSIDLPIQSQNPNALKVDQPSAGSHSTLIKKIRNSFPDDIQRDADARNKQRSTLSTTTSSSHVGTDHIPHGHPVDSRARLNLLSFQSSLN